MEQLQEALNRLLAEHPGSAQIAETLLSRQSFLPFNNYEYQIAALLSAKLLSFEEYSRLREEYTERNPYLDLFEMSPSKFGTTWAEKHLRSLVTRLIKPTKKTDKNYAREYDLLLNSDSYANSGIKIEVKASRAVEYKSDKPLYLKALASDSPKRFEMNFQQSKPDHCDVFIWIGVWRNQIRYWVLASHEVANHPAYSGGQHRGNVGEGQLHLTRENLVDFVRFEASAEQLENSIREAYRRQMSNPQG